MRLTESKELGNVELNRLMENRRITTERWNKVGFLKGLDGAEKENMAQLFENQLQWMKGKGKHIIAEATQATSSGSYETVAFPVIRRVFGNLLLNDIASVQAMSLPIGKLYYMNPKISKRREDDPDFVDTETHYPADNAYVNAARTRGKYGDTGSTAPETLVQFQEVNLYDAWYATKYDGFGDALFDRSKGRKKLVTGTTEIVSGAIGDDFVTVKITGFNETNAGKLVGGSGVEVDTEAFLSSLVIFPDGTLEAEAGFENYNLTPADEVPSNVKVQNWGQSIINSAGELILELDLTYPAEVYKAFTGGTASGFNAVWADYSDLEQDSEMGEVSFQLDDVEVSVTSRKLRAQWTPELSMDVQQFHNIDAEAELTALLSETMGAELDREGVRDMRRVAAWVTRWDYNGLSKITGNFYGTQKDWNQTLLTKVNQISAQIMKATLRGGANWLIVSPEIGAVLNDLEYFHVTDASPEQTQYNMGIERIGSIRGQYTVYQDPYAPANLLLIGRKGSSILESGYIYAPYVPMELTPVLQDTRDFTYTRGIQTRYAKKTVNNRFYGRISVDGLQTFGIGDLR